MNTILKEQRYPLLIIFISALVRFTNNIPVLFIDDSVKYFVPLPIIEAHNFNWVLDTINFSLLQRVLSYFVQSFDNGSVINLVVINKTLAIASALIFYFIAIKLSQGRQGLSFIATLIFTLDPLNLYIEQVIMPESVFIFLILSASLFIIKMFERDRYMYLYAIMTGLCSSLASLTKETAVSWLMILTITLLLIGIYEAIKLSNKSMLIAAILICSTNFLVKLPMRLYNMQKHQQFKVSVYSTSGVILWSLTEDMIRNNPSSLYPWITQGILDYTNSFRAKLGQGSPKDQAFYQAISIVNTLGREGKVIHPQTQSTLSSEQWAKICLDYSIDTMLKNPISTLSRIFTLSLPNLFLSSNLHLNNFRGSLKKDLDYEVPEYTLIPFSLKLNVDPPVDSKPMIIGKDAINQFKEAQSKKSFLLMINNDTDIAFTLTKNNISLLIQDLFQDLTFAKIIIPAFFISVLIFISSKPSLLSSLTELYILGTALFYALFPMILVQGEPRYRLQFIPFMLLFIVYLISSRKNRKIK